MTARGLRPLMDSLAGRVRDSGGASAASASEEALAAAPMAAAEARKRRRDRRNSRSIMGGHRRRGGESESDMEDITWGPALPGGAGNAECAAWSACTPCSNNAHHAAACQRG